MKAVIDIGTNSVLLLIADLSSKFLRVIKDEARITRLGEKLYKNKRFLPAAQVRTLEILKEYDSLCKKNGVTQVLCAGTAAFRKAENGREFQEEIANRFGWETRILSGEEEARLSYLSVERDFGDRYENLVALDIGGGSTEIIGSKLKGQSSKAKGFSIPLGTVILSEAFIHSDPPEVTEVDRLENEIKSILASSLSPFTFHLLPVLVSLAGTATTLSSINQRLPRWDPDKVQGSVIPLPELEKMISLFRGTTHDEKKRMVGMLPGREDTILVGSLILKAVMHPLGVNRVIVSDRGVRYGLLYDWEQG